MVEALLGKKLGMTQVFTEAGVTVPVTVIQVEPNHVTQLRTPERDGYSAVQLGFCLLYTSPSPRDRQKSRMPSSA